MADLEAEAASRKGVASGVGPRTATSAVAYDDDDDDDDDDGGGGGYFGSRDSGARRYRSGLER